MKRIGLELNPIRFFVILVISFLLTGCGFQSSTNDLTGWARAHLLWLGNSEAAPSQGQVIAAYFRQTNQDAQIRIDLMELSDVSRLDIFLALDSIPGGTNTLPDGKRTDMAWDILFHYSTGQPPTTITPDGTTSTLVLPRVVIDPNLDTAVISWNNHALSIPSVNLAFQVFVKDETEESASSKTPVLRLGQTSTASAPLVLTFWNALPASTPAQTLRRWDGAHTGPLGQRHGLNVLTGLASKYNVPLILLDLRHPQSLRALEYMQVAQPLKNLTFSGVLTIPAYAWGNPALSSQSLDLTTNLSQDLGWPQSKVAFGSFRPPLPSGYTHFFADLPDRNHILEYNGRQIIPLPVSFFNPEAQVDSSLTTSGLSLSIKKALITAALSPDPADLVILGGNLSQSLWAENSIAPQVFEYIATHPWIMPLTTRALLEFPSLPTANWPLPACQDLLCTPAEPDASLYTSSKTPIPSGMTFHQLSERLGEQLVSLSSNGYAQMARELYFNLTQPTPSPSLSSLRAAYLHQVGYLIFASNWAVHPYPLASCALDLDWDGQPECILATEKSLAMVELDGGRLILAGSPDTLWVGASSLFAVGTGDPALWDPTTGPAADPQVFAGQFSTVNSPFIIHQVERLTANQLDLYIPGGQQKISFSLSPNTLQIQITSSTPYQTQIPLILDTVSTPAGMWSVDKGVTCLQSECSLAYSTGRLSITTRNGQLVSHSFLDSAPYMTSAEIPDRSYPSGHFFPFHVAVLNLTKLSETLPVSVRFEFQP